MRGGAWRRCFTPHPTAPWPSCESIALKSHSAFKIQYVVFSSVSQYLCSDAPDCHCRVTTYLACTMGSLSWSSNHPWEDQNHIAYGSPQHSAPPAAVQTLPSVADLLSSRPLANSTSHNHHQGYFHPRPTPLTTSLAAPTASTAPAATYWNSVNHHQTSPPVR
jgi:hypothetical protein